MAKRVACNKCRTLFEIRRALLEAAEMIVKIDDAISPSPTLTTSVSIPKKDWTPAVEAAKKAIAKATQDPSWD